ncbi:MAG: ATP-dependent Clp protease ATP-binding subunit [Treponema sp.]|nr:ATP-dependent Clp protease ATP-binding subunit [Treponema sp.]
MKGLSPRAQRLIVALAQDEARKCGAVELIPEHVLLALLKSAEGIGYLVLQNLHINVLAFQLALEQSLPAPRTTFVDFSEIPPSRRMRTMLDMATVESRTLRNDYVGTEHLLVAALREESSPTARFFERAGLSLDVVRKEIYSLQQQMQLVTENGEPSSAQGNQQASPSQNQQKQAKQQKTFLSEFSRDLTQLSREGKLDPVVGRNSEIQRVIQILSRRTKNNPVLLGEPGVGKTAIVEGLAQHIASGNVPRNLLKKRILSLDLVAMVAGTKYRGEFEERMKRMMSELKADGNIILFLDEIHTIIGAGGPEGTGDASNILKPALSRGEVQIIGATTLREYRRYFERDSALERRFQTVKVGEPDVQDSTAILEGLKKQYEAFHGVVYDDDVIPAIVKFSIRYIPERFLPDKAIDILDEAGSAKKIQEETRPAQLAELEKSIEALSAEKTALVQEQDYEKAALVRDKVRDLKQKLEEFSTYWRNNAGGEVKRVTVDDICVIISRMTGIPLEQLDSNESKKLLHMEDELHSSVIGQDEAVRLLSSAIRRSRAGVSSTKRPLGSFIFLGPTGVGKTQLAKSLAKFLFGTEDALIRIDMSDYMEKHNASRLVGAPPGYVGYEEGGVLTEKVRQKPYSVVLLDEIEKAHPDIFNLLLQLLEEGQLSDNFGHVVNFRNTVIIMTSNAGAREITADRRLGFTAQTEGLLPYSDIRSSAMEELKRIMSPELLNRIDDVVVFNALSREQVSKILDIQLAELESRLEEKSITLSLKPKARSYLLDHGYDVSMGARPMRRLIQREIEDPLSLLILADDDTDSRKAVVDVRTAHGEICGLSVRFAKKRNDRAVPALVSPSAVSDSSPVDSSASR